MVKVCKQCGKTHHNRNDYCSKECNELMDLIIKRRKYQCRTCIYAGNLTIANDIGNMYCDILLKTNGKKRHEFMYPCLNYEGSRKQWEKQKNNLRN